MKKIFPILALLSVAPTWATTFYTRGDGTATTKAAATACSSASTATNVTYANSLATTGDTVIICSDGGNLVDAILTPAASGITYSPMTGESPVVSGSNIPSWTLDAVSSGTNFTSGYGLDGWWRFQTLGSLGTDSSGSSNTLTLTNAPTQTTGPNANVPNGIALVAASSQYLTKANSGISAGFPGKSAVSFTAGAWVKPNSLSSSREVMSMGCAWDFSLYNTTDGAFIVWDSGYGAHTVYAPTTTFATGRWTVIAGTWNSSTHAVTFYINGVSVGTPGTATSMLADTSDPFGVGYSTSGCSANADFDGVIAEPFVMTTVLTAAQLTAMYSAGMSGSSFHAYYAAASVSPNQVLEDNSRMTSVGALASLTAGTFYYSSPSIYIRTFEDAVPTGHTVEVAQRDEAMLINNVQNITVTGGEFRAGNKFGLLAEHDFSGLSLSGVLCDYNYAEGCYLATLGGGATITGASTVSYTHL